MAFLNLGFEDENPGASGTPDDWAVTFTATADEVAAYDDGNTFPPVFPVPFETFGGGWSTNESYLFAYAEPIDLGEIFPAFYDNALPDPEAFEDFEDGWSTNESYLFTMGSISAAIYDIGVPETVENFEEEWPIGTFAFSWADVLAGLGEDAADYDTGPTIQVEDYERQWRTNEAFDFTMGSTTAAVFDTGVGGGSQAVEDFEEANPLQVITVVVGTDTVNAISNGLANGQTVMFENEGGALPAGLLPGTVYFVINWGTNTFKVSATSGGAAVDITDDGTGTHRVRPDTATFWTTFMATL